LDDLKGYARVMQPPRWGLEEVKKREYHLILSCTGIRHPGMIAI